MIPEKKNHKTFCGNVTDKKHRNWKMMVVVKQTKKKQNYRKFIFSIHRERQKCAKSGVEKSLLPTDGVKTFEKNLVEWNSFELSYEKTTTKEFTSVSTLIEPDFMRVVTAKT